jgi:hypothetical protein
MSPNPFKRCKVDPSCLKDESLILICDWENCTEEDGRRKVFHDMEVFLLHVAEVCVTIWVKSLLINYVFN